jgi:hypothetical protein
MKRLAVFTLACLFAAPVFVSAGEHPEHPKSKQKKEHSKAKKKSRSAKKKGKWVKDSPTMKAFVAAVEDYVADKQESEGAFKVYDNRLDKTWDLELLRIHKKRIARLGEDKFFACADFKEVGRKGKRKTLDLDFFVSRDEDGNFVVDEIPVHKVQGKPRYTYNKNNERVPVGKAQKSEKKKKMKRKSLRKKKREHPEHPTGGGHEHPEHPN